MDEVFDQIDKHNAKISQKSLKKLVQHPDLTKFSVVMFKHKKDIQLEECWEGPCIIAQVTEWHSYKLLDCNTNQISNRNFARDQLKVVYHSEPAKAGLPKAFVGLWTSRNCALCSWDIGGKQASWVHKSELDRFRPRLWEFIVANWKSIHMFRNQPLLLPQ